MSRAETNILCYLEAAGRTSYVKICDHFSLMSKNVIDDTLTMLIERGLIGVTQEGRPWEYWSIKTGPKPKPTAYATALEWVQTQDEFTTAEFRDAMPAKKARAVEYLGVLEEKGEIVATGRGQWRRNTPSEATREAGAPATTDVPEAVATPEPVGDAPVVSAEETPAGNGAGGADQWDPDLLRKTRQYIDEPMPLPTIPHDALNKLAKQAREEAMQGAGLQDVYRGPRLPHAEFRMTNGDVEIVITGSPSEVHRVVSMLDQALMA